MTERKPPGVSFESWVDKQIREAVDRGEFDNVSGAGEPIRDLDTPYDEVWVQRKLRDDGVSTEDLLPTPLKLRKEIERLPDTVRKLRSEPAVRNAVEELNGRINAWLRAPLGGPPVHVAPVDVEPVVEQWRATRTATTDVAGTADHPDKSPTATPADRRPWWHRFTRRTR